MQAQTTHVHKLLSVDPETRIGICKACGPVELKLRITKNGRKRWTCRPGETKRNVNRRPHRAAVIGQDTCSRCGFVAVDVCQLDVHHRDRDHGNNAPENLEVLCSNCHRLEHRLGPGEKVEAVQAQHLRLL